MNKEKDLYLRFIDDLRKDVNLSNYSWFNLGGNADYFYKAKDINLLIEFLTEIKKEILKQLHFRCWFKYFI